MASNGVVDVREFLRLRSRLVGFVAVGVWALAVVCLPVPVLASTVAGVIVQHTPGDASVMLPTRTAVAPMVLALEAHSIGDTSSFGAAQAPPSTATRMAGLTSLAALRERMGSSKTGATPTVKDTLPIVLQIGSFADRDNAVRLEDKLAGEFKSVYVTPSQLGARQLFRVRVGSFATKAELESAERQLRAGGYQPWRLQAAASAAGSSHLHSSR